MSLILVSLFNFVTIKQEKLIGCIQLAIDFTRPRSSRMVPCIPLGKLFVRSAVHFTSHSIRRNSSSNRSLWEGAILSPDPLSHDCPMSLSFCYTTIAFIVEIQNVHSLTQTEAIVLSPDPCRRQWYLHSILTNCHYFAEVSDSRWTLSCLVLFERLSWGSVGAFICVFENVSGHTSERFKNSL